MLKHGVIRFSLVACSLALAGLAQAIEPVRGLGDGHGVCTQSVICFSFDSFLRSNILG